MSSVRESRDRLNPNGGHDGLGGGVLRGGHRPLLSTRLQAPSGSAGKRRQVACLEFVEVAQVAVRGGGDAVRVHAVDGAARSPDARARDSKQLRRRQSNGELSTGVEHRPANPPR